MPQYATTMRILVTGGFGFIGSNFCRIAAQRGHEIIVLDKLTYAADPSNIEDTLKKDIQIFHLDLSDETNLRQSFSEMNNIEWIVNFAAESHVDRSIKDGAPFVKSNILGVVNILEYMKENPQIKLLQVSTDEVFGTIDQGSWDEDFPINPRSAYSSSKASAELFCKAYKNTHGLQVYITRCANNFGPRQSAEKLIPTVINSILSGQKIPVYGNGLNRREWIFVDNHVHALLKIIEATKPNFQTYNIGGTEKSNIEIIQLFLDRLGMDSTALRFVEDRLGHDFRYSVSDERYIREFGSYLLGNFEEQIQETLDWYLANEEWLQKSLSRLKK
jgi:dTDP-glucose 4,6-dehydratase